MIVFSARAIRSDLRQRFANLIHIAGSSSGLRTKARTWSIRCHTSTSGWQPCNLGEIMNINEVGPGVPKHLPLHPGLLHPQSSGHQTIHFLSCPQSPIQINYNARHVVKLGPIRIQHRHLRFQVSNYYLQPMHLCLISFNGGFSLSSNICGRRSIITYAKGLQKQTWMHIFSLYLLPRTNSCNIWINQYNWFLSHILFLISSKSRTYVFSL